MTIPLPPDINVSAFNAALRDFAAAIGSDAVFASDEDRAAYSDHFALDEQAHAPAAAIAPANSDEVREVVRIANRHKIPLWPISRGKNFGYGGAAPRLRGSVVLDLSRMRKIEIDEANGIAIVEPGVGFYDLYNYLKERNIPYWSSPVGNSWGSVLGNALDRGVGYTNYGDHAANICGMEVVLPDGDLVRTGMGAMANSPNWHLYRPGFGPSWDQAFVQSNFGIVTRAGMWLMPAPQSMISIDVELDKPEDLGWIVDVLAVMRRDGLLRQSPSIGNWLRGAAVLTTRQEWYDKPGLLPADVIEKIRKRYNIGWWSAPIRLYGLEEMNETAARIIIDRINKAGSADVRVKRWKEGDPPGKTPFEGVPITFALQNANWFGGRGGHVSFSPVLPSAGDLAMAQFRRTHALYEKYGFDYHASFSMGERHITNVNQILFDKDNPDMVTRADQMFRELVDDATAQRYGEYRTHLDYMDLVAETYDFNNHALRRLNEKVKNALDPNGIVAPGKSGIWPSRYEGERKP
ncbi:MAG: FAD-binding oxidoreductase [Spongiibacteraceae bacterium]|jgi:4-cresol dehydrogenase (hydroxylating)|nr:FAD-binding oxidoreductase [Spongiibacteraceae bacterium]